MTMELASRCRQGPGPGSGPPGARSVDQRIGPVRPFPSSNGCSIVGSPMDRHADRAAALASLRVRWGSAAPRPATEVFGALAAAPLPAEAGAADALPPAPEPSRPALVPLPGGSVPALVPRPLPGEPARDVHRAIPTGFAELDALLAAGGLPRAGTVALRGAGLERRDDARPARRGGGPGRRRARRLGRPRPEPRSGRGGRSGRAPRVARHARSRLDRRGARDGRLAPPGQGRRRPRPRSRGDRRARGGSRVRRRGPRRRGTRHPGRPRAARGGRRAPPLGDRLARLVAFARRTGALLLVLEPAEAPTALRAALAEGSSLALELRRTGWIRLGREVVGQRTEVRVAKDRHGAPDRRTTLRLLYAEGGPRDRCLARDELLAEEPVAERAARTGTGPPLPVPLTAATPSLLHEPDRSTDAPPPPLLAPSRAPARPRARHLDLRDRAADPRRAAVG